jgi:hypothetical protein
MAHICERLSLSDHLKNGLIHGAGPYAPFLRVIIAHEIGDQAACRTVLDSIGVSPEALQQSYLQALTFVEQVYI